MSRLQKLLMNPQRILIIQFGTLGETIQTVPLLVALRTRYPFADIAWLCRQDTSSLLHNHWAVNRVIIVPEHWRKSLNGIKLLRQQIRSFAPQITLDVQNTFWSRSATWLYGAKLRLHKIAETQETPEEQIFALLEPFGIAGCSIDYDLPVCEMDQRSAVQKLYQIGLRTSNFAVLNVGAVSEPARWSEQRFGQLAKYFLEQWNLPSLVVCSNRNECRFVETVVDVAGGAALAAPFLLLSELAAVFKYASIFVSSDAEFLHLAGALGTHCVGIYGPTLGTQNIPFGQQNRVVQVKHREGHQHSRKIRRDYIDAVDVELVCDICDEVLGGILQPDTIPMPQQEPLKRAA